MPRAQLVAALSAVAIAPLEFFPGENSECASHKHAFLWADIVSFLAITSFRQESRDDVVILELDAVSDLLTLHSHG